MPLTTTAPALATLLQNYLEPLAAFGGGDPKMAAWCNAVAKAITEWIAANGTDAVTLVQGAVTVTTTGSATNQAGGGPLVSFTGKVI